MEYDTTQDRKYLIGEQCGDRPGVHKLLGQVEDGRTSGTRKLLTTVKRRRTTGQEYKDQYSCENESVVVYETEMIDFEEV